MSAELATLSQIKQKKDMYSIHQDFFNPTKMIDVSEMFPNTFQAGETTFDTNDVLGDASCLATWQLNGDATDLGGTYNGTIVGTLGTVEGRFGNALTFNDNTANYITMGPGIVSFKTNSHTISAWVYLTTYASASVHTIFSNHLRSSATGSTINSGSRLDILNNTGELRATYTMLDDESTTDSNGNLNTTYSSIVISKNAVPLNEWVHVLGIIDTNHAEVYINGVFEGSVDSIQNIRYSSIDDNLSIGALKYDAAVHNPFNGSIDQVRFFNRVLTPSEIEKLYGPVTRKIVLDIEEPTEHISTIDNVDPFDDDSGVALYKFNGDVLDESGNYPGTPTDITYGSGKFDNAGIFNGLSSVVTPTGLVAQSHMTTSVWLKFTTLKNSFIVAALQKTNNLHLTTTYPLLLLDTGNFFVRLSNGVSHVTGTDASVSYSGIEDGNWHHVATSYNDTKFDIFIDSVQIASLSPTVANTSASGIDIGGSLDPNVAGLWNFDGEIDQVRIFNKALTQKEINTLYNEKVER